MVSEKEGLRKRGRKVGRLVVGNIENLMIEEDRPLLIFRADHEEKQGRGENDVQLNLKGSRTSGQEETPLNTNCARTISQETRNDDDWSREPSDILQHLRRLSLPSTSRSKRILN